MANPQILLFSVVLVLIWHYTHLEGKRKKEGEKGENSHPIVFGLAADLITPFRPISNIFETAQKVFMNSFTDQDKPNSGWDWWPDRKWNNKEVLDMKANILNNSARWSNQMLTHKKNILDIISTVKLIQRIPRQK